MSWWSREAIKVTAVSATGNLGYQQLKQVIASFVEGQDVFVSLPKKRFAFCLIYG